MEQFTQPTVLALDSIAKALNNPWVFLVNVIIAFISLAAAIAAWRAATQTRAAAKYAKESADVAKKSLEADILLRLSERFDSEFMVQRRGQAANDMLAALSSKSKVDISSVERVLDFFETIATFTNSGALPLELVWNEFYDSIHGYWLLSENYINELREENPVYWQNLTDLHKQLVAFEESESKNRSGIDWSEEEKRDFISREAMLTMKVSSGY